MQGSNPDARMHRIEVVLSELDQTVTTLGQQVALLGAMQAASASGNPSAGEDGDTHPMRDKVWSCTNCAARLGIYDKSTDELRVRYKDFICYVRPGAGGTVEVPCRRCGQRNKLADDR